MATMLERSATYSSTDIPPPGAWPEPLGSLKPWSTPVIGEIPIAEAAAQGLITADEAVTFGPQDAGANGSAGRNGPPTNDKDARRAWFVAAIRDSPAVTRVTTRVIAARGSRSDASRTMRAGLGTDADRNLR